MAANRVVFNLDELNALAGLPHLTQLIYFRAIRPEMDYQSGLVGIRTSRTKKISYQSIAEAVYVEPETGRVTPEKLKKGKLRWAVNQLVDAGLIEVIPPANPTDRQLIFKCVLADVGYSVQNKDSTPPAHHSEKSQHTSSTPDKSLNASDSNGFNGVDSEESAGKSAHQQHTNSEKDSTPRSTEFKTYTHNSRASRDSVISADFGIDEQVKVYLRMSRVSEAEALVYLPEFKMANLTSQHRSANWPAEFVKYCCVQKRYTESFEQRMAEKNKVKNKTPLRLVGTAGDSGDGSHGFNTED